MIDRKQIEQKLKELEEQHAKQQTARVQQAVVLDQMDAALQQMRGGMFVLRALLEETEPLEEPMA